MNKKAIEALAEYFSGVCVAYNSERYFNCRQALGMRYYESKEEATALITKALEKEDETNG